MNNINTSINRDSFNYFYRDGGTNGDIKAPLLGPRLTQIEEEKQKILTASGKDYLDFFSKDIKSTANKFLKSVMYKVDLSELYKIKDTCYYSQVMPYCPIIVHDIKQNNYLLQVWTNSGEISMEVALNDMPQAWCITSQVLVFKPSISDQDGGNRYRIFYLYLQNQEFEIDVNGIQEVENIEQSLLGFCNKCLYISVRDTMYILNLNSHLNGIKQVKKIFLGEVINYGIFILQEFNISQIQDSSYVIIACETSDNQIDFAKLIYDPNSDQYKIEQVAEVVKRSAHFERGQFNSQAISSNDPIVKFQCIYDRKQMPHGIVLRSSGNVDFYWNYRLTDNRSPISQLNKEIVFSDVQLNFDAFYLYDHQQKMTRISLNYDDRICLEDAKQVQFGRDIVVDFDDLFQYKINSHVNFYSAQCLVGTSFIIAHNRTVYIYDIIKNKWGLKFTCSDQIYKIFRTEQRKCVFDIAIVLRSGQIVLLQNTDSDYLSPSKWHLKVQDNLKVQGFPKQVLADLERPQMMYILHSTLEQDRLALTEFWKGKLYKITDKIQGSSVLIPLYHSRFNNNAHKTPQDPKFILYSRNGSQGKLQIYQSSFEKQNGIQLNSPKMVKNFKTFIDTSINFNASQLEDDDKIHAALSSDINDSIYLVGRKNIYVIDDEKVVSVIKNVNIFSLQMLDNFYCYALVRNHIKCNSGVKLFCVKSLFCLEENQNLRFIDIESTIASNKNFIDFSEDNQRCIYMKNYDMVHIIPPLHRSTISFIGMRPRDRYLAVNKIENKFLALDKNNRITTWNSLSGKLNDFEQINDVDYSSYFIFGFDQKNIIDHTYTREWYRPRSLIVSKIKIEGDQQRNVDCLNEINGSISYDDQKVDRVSQRQFKLIEIKGDNEVAEVMSFVHSYYQDRIQILIISDDCNIMIEKLLNHQVLIYRRSFSTWKLLRRFKDFPHELSQQSQFNYLFSPDLKRYLNFDKIKNCLIIQETLSPYKILRIPTNTYENVHEVTKRFNWIDNNSFLLASSLGFEKRFYVTQNQIKEISSSQIPCYSLLNNSKQIFVEQESLLVGDIRRRLLRKHQMLKRARFIFQENWNNQIQNELFSIDYNTQNGMGKFVADFSFSYIQWKLIEEIEKNNISINQIDVIWLKQLCLNILPGCITILHRLVKRTQDLQFIFDNASVTSAQGDIPFEMPFIRDIKGKTPLHLCTEAKDFKTADLILQYLADAPLDHHSRDIKDLLPIMIKEQVPSLPTYLESRMISTSDTGTIRRGSIKSYSSSIDWAMHPASIWEDPHYIKSNMFIEAFNNSTVEADVQFKYIDLPEYHNLNSKYCIQFFLALKDTDNLQLFELKSIRAMIEYQWPLAKKYTKIFLLYPFIAYLFSFWVYTNFIDDLGSDRITNPDSFYPWFINLVVLILLSVYFLMNEVRQIKHQRINYFKQIWNYIDLIPPFIILWISILNLLEVKTHLEETLKSVGSLLMWLKLLYFCRVNKYTGYLIRMIVKVIFRMSTFLTVLLITVTAVADAYISIMDRPIIDHDNILESFLQRIIMFINNLHLTYSMILGGDKIEVDKANHSILSHVLSLFCSLFVMIVMLNLLISIIGDIFGKVQENQINEYYQEKASIIAENCYLIPSWVRNKESNNDGHLLLVCAKEDFSMKHMDDEELPRQKLIIAQSKLFKNITEIIDKRMANLQPAVSATQNYISQSFARTVTQFQSAI